MIPLEKLEIILMDADAKEEKYTTYCALINGPQSISMAKDPEVSNDDILLLPYSSGTTGVPKGVMITSGNLKAHILQIAVDDLGFYNPPVSGKTPDVAGSNCRILAMHCNSFFQYIISYRLI